MLFLWEHRQALHSQIGSETEHIQSRIVKSAPVRHPFKLKTKLHLIGLQLIHTQIKVATKGSNGPHKVMGYVVAPNAVTRIGGVGVGTLEKGRNGMGFGMVPTPVLVDKSLGVRCTVIESKRAIESAVECMHLLGIHGLKTQHIGQPYKVDARLGLFANPIQNGHQTRYGDRKSTRL